MTKARAPKPRKEQRVPPDLKAWFRHLYHRGILGFLLVSLAVVTLIGLLYPEGSGFLVAWWSRLLLQALGWGSYLVLVGATGLGSLLVIGKLPDRKRIPWHIVIGIEIMLNGVENGPLGFSSRSRNRSSPPRRAGIAAVSAA